MIDADFAMAATSGAWEGASQDDPDPRLSESTPAPPLAPTPILPEAQSNYTQNVSIESLPFELRLPTFTVRVHRRPPFSPKYPPSRGTGSVAG